MTAKEKWIIAGKIVELIFKLIWCLIVLTGRALDFSIKAFIITGVGFLCFCCLAPIGIGIVLFFLSFFY